MFMAIIFSEIQFYELIPNPRAYGDKTLITFLEGSELICGKRDKSGEKVCPLFSHFILSFLSKYGLVIYATALFN